MPPSARRIAARQFALAALAVLLSPLALTSPARADLKVCNDTANLVGVSVGYRNDEGWVSEGWWRIPAKNCASIIEGDLGSRFYYIHAEDEAGAGRWRGPVFMCTSIKEFRIEGLEDCYSRGYERTGFFEVDTGDQKSWQVRLSAASRSDGETN